MTYGFLCSALCRGERAASVVPAINSKHERSMLPCNMVAMGDGMARDVRHRIRKSGVLDFKYQKSRDACMKSV